MKHINEYNKFNEGVLSQIRKLGPGDRENTKNLFLGRAIDDVAAKKIFKRMQDDFIKYDKDCRKIKIMGDHSFSYVMGKYDIIKNSAMSGNHPDDKNQEKISVYFWKKEGLELSSGRIEIEITKPNPKHDPNLSATLGWNRRPTEEERERLAVIKQEEEMFKISYDVAKKIYDYFNDEFIKQYPQLKDATHKNEWSIKEIEKGEEPRLGSVDLFDPKGTEIIYSYRKLEDRPKLMKYIKNNVCIEGRNKDRYPVTYFTEPGEDEDAVRDNIVNWSQKEINKQNMERVHKYIK